MAEYIEREAAQYVLRERYRIRTHFHDMESAAQLKCAELEIGDIPAADVRPVVRGRDICDTVEGHCEFKCSVCGVELSSVYGGNNDFGLDGGYFNFCPNCGAMMEES